jgi:hypothetical protein
VRQDAVAQSPAPDLIDPRWLLMGCQKPGSVADRASTAGGQSLVVKLGPMSYIFSATRDQAEDDCERRAATE